MAYADPIRAATADFNDVASLIEGIFSSSFPATLSTWTPTYSASPGTFSSVTTTVAKYIQIGKMVFFFVQGFGTTATSPTSLRFTVPVTMAASVGAWAAWTADGGATLGSVAYPVSTTTIGVGKVDASAYGNGANRFISCSGWYEAL